MADNKNAFDVLTHAPASGPLPKAPANAAPATWGANSAHMAYITLQQPMRVAIHASAMITPGN
jgi:hypothetical protein